MGRHGRLLDASVLEALLCPGGVHSDAALLWLQQVRDAPLAVSGASVLQLEARLRSRGDDSVWGLLDAFLGPPE